MIQWFIPRQPTGVAVAVGLGQKNAPPKEQRTQIGGNVPMDVIRSQCDSNDLIPQFESPQFHLAGRYLELFAIVTICFQKESFHLPSRGILNSRMEQIWGIHLTKNYLWGNLTGNYGQLISTTAIGMLALWSQLDTSKTCKTSQVS